MGDFWESSPQLECSEEEQTTDNDVISQWDELKKEGHVYCYQRKERTCTRKMAEKPTHRVLIVPLPSLGMQGPKIIPSGLLTATEPEYISYMETSRLKS